VTRRLFVVVVPLPSLSAHVLMIRPMSMSTGSSVGQDGGEVFTRQWVVDTLLDLTGYTADRDLGVLSLVRSVLGSGSFLLRAAERLLESARLRGRSPNR
jgi:hypothetical protein